MRHLLSALILVIAATVSGCAGKTDEGSFGTNFYQYDNLINVRLDGANDASVAEAFGKIVGSSEGVVGSTMYGSRIVPDTPQASVVNWRVRVSGIDSFTLQTTIMDMSKELLRAGGMLTMQGVPYRYSKDEIAMLLGLRPVDATPRQLWFVIDRELARDREMSGW